MNAYEKGAYTLCGGYSEYTPTGKGYFVKAGRWHTVPEAGDVVYFYTASLGRVSHVGIVTAVDAAGRTFSTIEGNTSGDASFSRNGGCVYNKTYSYANVGGDNRVNGFGRPRYGEYCRAEDVIAAAEAELGYLEKSKAGYEGATDRAATEEEKKCMAGSANFTKYGKWYGDNGAYWCQQFVSWCFYKACKDVSGIVPGWKQVGEAWKYMKQNGEYAADEWQLINGWWFAFDGACCMVTGWFESDGEWYYLNTDGAMASGCWVYDGGKYYYLTKSGAMATDAYIWDIKTQKYCYVGKDGQWEPEKDKAELEPGDEVAGP